MSTSVEDHEFAEMNVEPAHHEHPPESLYIKVAIVLAIFTAIEVALSYTGFNEDLTIVALLFFAVLKFGTVVAYFMHLKFDHPWFRRLFVTGLVLAVFCYIAYLATLDVFSR
jgi:cytochrome c oxidase subunit IV